MADAAVLCAVSIFQKASHVASAMHHANDLQGCYVRTVDDQIGEDGPESIPFGGKIGPPVTDERLASRQGHGLLEFVK